MLHVCYFGCILKALKTSCKTLILLKSITKIFLTNRIRIVPSIFIMFMYNWFIESYEKLHWSSTYNEPEALLVVLLRPRKEKSLNFFNVYLFQIPCLPADIFNNFFSLRYTSYWLSRARSIRKRKTSLYLWWAWFQMLWLPQTIHRKPHSRERGGNDRKIL